MEGSDEATANARRDERLPAGMNCPDRLHDFADGRRVDRPRLAKSAPLVGMLEDLEERPDDIVDIHQIQRRSRIVDRDGEAAGDIVTESGHGRVVVGPRPFPENVRETEEVNGSAGRFRIGLEHLFGPPLAAAVGVVERRLGRRAEDHRLLPPRGGEDRAQPLGRAGVAGGVICWIGGPVDPGEMNDAIGRRSRRPERLFGRPAADRQHLMPADFSEPDAEVAPQESFGASDEHPHGQPSGYLGRALRMISRPRRICFTSSTERRFVLWEV